MGEANCLGWTVKRAETVETSLARKTPGMAAIAAEAAVERKNSRRFMSTQSETFVGLQCKPESLPIAHKVVIPTEVRRGGRSRETCGFPLHG